MKLATLIFRIPVLSTELSWLHDLKFGLSYLCKRISEIFFELKHKAKK